MCQQFLDYTVHIGLDSTYCPTDIIKFKVKDVKFEGKSNSLLTDHSLHVVSSPKSEKHNILNKLINVLLPT